jgi:Mn2+/Fe2+ NRAMP family transporter
MTKERVVKFRRLDKKKIFLFLSILGPGMITANVDNDAGGITTYSMAGAHFGYSLLWTLIPITIVPWMQFYLQSSVVEKNIKVEDYRYSRMDVITGCVITDVVALFIIVACGATLFKQGIHIEDAKDAALALAPLAGKYASTLFAIGLANASLFAASILPLATAYYVCEGMGWESGIDKDFRTAPQFFWLYTGLIVLGALLVLIPNAPLVLIMFLSQVANGILLPFVLVYMLKLINDRDLMGEYVNSKAFNGVAWTTTIVMIVLTVLLAIVTVFPGLPRMLSL